MSIQSVIDHSELLIIQIQRESDGFKNSHFKTQGQSLYEKLVQWVSESKKDDAYEEAICTIFSLLKELRAKDAFSEQLYQSLRDRAIATIRCSTHDPINPHLDRFLIQQTL